jgi:DNA-binding XRE family transcriptional regulator
LLSEKADKIINAIKNTYDFKTDKELGAHFGLSSQSVANARKKVPLRWVLICQKETGVSLDFLLGVDLPEVKKNESHGIGTRLREVRGGISLPDFAQSLDVHRSTVIRWEQDEIFPDAVLVRKICDLYQVDPVWLLYGGKSQVIGIEKVMDIMQTVVKKLSKIQAATCNPKKQPTPDHATGEIKY